MKSPSRLNRTAGLLAGTALAASPAAFAADIFWNAPQASTALTNSANYMGGVAPGANDTAIFSTQFLADNGNPLTATKTLNPNNTAKAFNSLTFDYGTSGAFLFQIPSGQTGSLLLSAGGTVQTIGNQTAALTTTLGRPIAFLGNYTLSSNTTSGGTGQSNLTVSGALTFSSAAASTLTVRGSAGSVETVTGQVGTSLLNRAGGTISSVIADGGVGAPVSIVKEDAGVWQFGAANTYTGGTAIRQGTIVTTNSTSLGTGAVTLGDSGVGQNASLLANSNVNIANAITVAGGAGLRILGTNAQSNPATFSGGITLNTGSNLRLQNQSASRNLVISGGITGSGNVEVYHNNANATTTGVVFGTNAINNIGTVTNASPGNGTLTQTAGGILGSNVTEFIQNSATSITTFSLANTYGSTTILAGTLATVGTGTLGTGDVIVNGGLLDLGSSISLSDTAMLSFISSVTPTIFLNNGFTDVVDRVYNITTSTYMDAGIWSASDLNTFFGTDAFSGLGTLTVVTAVPEPSTYALGILGLLATVAFVRRRRHAA